MTSVAYSEQPQLPGVLTTTLALVMGWISAAFALVLLYIAASAVGVISQSDATDAGVINEWPYYGGGAWSLFANIAALLIGLVLATVATSWWLRLTHAHVSDGRLAILLLLTGGIPLMISHRHDHHGPGFLGFILAVVFVRRWVVRHEGRWTLAPTIAVLVVLCAVVVSYGWLHPLWTASAYSTGRTGRYCTVAVDIHNAARAGVTIDRIDATSFTLSPARPARLYLAPRADKVITLRYLGGSGGGISDVRAHYHVFGLALSESVPFRIQLQNNC